MPAWRVAWKESLGVVLALAVGAACSSGANSAAPTTTTPSIRSATTVDPAVPRARSVLLTTADLPQGWKSFSPRPVDSAPDAGPAQPLSSCLGVDAALLRHNHPGHVFVMSPVYQAPDFTTVIQTIDVAPSAAAAEQDFAVLARTDFATCLGRAMGTVLTAEAQAQSSGSVMVTATKAAPLAFPAHGDRSAAFRANVSITYANEPAYVYIDFLITQVGATTSVVQFERTYAPPDPGLERSVANTVAGRLPA